MMEVLETQGQERAQEQEAHRDQTALLDVIDRSLDKGLVIEGWHSARVLGIELLTLDIDAIVASCARYLAIAEALEALEAIEETAEQSDTDGGEPEILPPSPSASHPGMR